jgi:hypothetical protein
VGSQGSVKRLDSPASSSRLTVSASFR